MRPLSQALTELIGFTEQIITQPRIATNLSPEGAFAKLAAELRHADALPAEGIRTTRAAMVTLICLEEFFAGDREPTSQLLGIAGAALPWLRGEAWVALRNEKEARPG